MSELEREFPHAAKFIRRMQALDSGYGAQRHQRDFVERMNELQRLYPCNVDHEHSPQCYTTAQTTAAMSWHMRKT